MPNIINSIENTSTILIKNVSRSSNSKASGVAQATAKKTDIVRVGLWLCSSTCGG